MWASASFCACSSSFCLAARALVDLGSNEGGERPVGDDIEGPRLPQAVVLHVKSLEMQICGNEFKMSIRFLSTFADWGT